MNMEIVLQPLMPLPYIGLLTVCILGLTIMHKLRGLSGTEFRVLAALLLAMVAFVGTVAYCKFLLRGDIVE